jgi:hypothetical protein
MKQQKAHGKQKALVSPYGANQATGYAGGHDFNVSLKGRGYICRQAVERGVDKLSQHTDPKAEIRRFGYYIPQPNGTIDAVVNAEVLSPDVLSEMHKVVRVVFDLQPIIFAFNVVERNYRELIDSIQEYRSQLIKITPNMAIPSSYVMEGLILASQKINNLLSSASAFLSQTETNLNRLHGKNSSKLTTWNEKRKSIHTASFSYRFLYELRNFAQHRSIPLSRFNIAGKRVADVAMVFKVDVLILRDELLDNGYDWKKLRHEIKQHPPEIDLLPLAKEYLHGLRQIGLEAVKYQTEQLALCGQYFDAWKSMMHLPAGAIPVVYIGESASPNEVPPSRFDLIPMEQYQYLLSKYEQLVKACGNGTSNEKN